MPKLKKFKKNNSNKVTTKQLMYATLIVVGLLSSFVAYKSYAIYKLQEEYDVIKNKIGNFSMGDVRVAVLVDGKEASEFPSYETNWKVESIECTNGVTANWDTVNWQLNIADMSATSTKCTISFNSNETNEETPINYTKEELIALNESLTDDFKNKLKKELLNETYPVGSIYISTTDSTVTAVQDKFGGTWVKYSQGTTLVGDDGTNYITNDSSKGSGGSKTATLSTSNLPSHSHTISHTHTTPSSTSGNQSVNHTHSIPTLSGTAASAGAHTHDIITKSNNSYIGMGWGAALGTTNGYVFNLGSGDGLLAKSAGAHTHSVSTVASTTGSNSANHTHSIPSMTTNSQSTTKSGDTGSGTAFSVQDPYTVVYMYKRTA